MLEKYRPNFESLTQREAALVASHVSRVSGDENFACDDGSLLYQRLENMSWNHAQVVLAVAPDPSPEAVVALEKLVGRPIVREPMPERQKRVSAPRDPSAPRGAARRRDDDRVIGYVAPNPKKPGSASHTRYQLYEVGKTIGDFLRAGGTTADVAWDIERGFVKIRETEAEQ